MTPELKLATAIRDVPATIQQQIASCQRFTVMDANDLVETLLAIADRLDPDGV